MELDGPTPQSQAEKVPQQQGGATQAEAASASAKQLMQGRLLDDIVLQHARWAHLLHVVSHLKCRAVHTQPVID